MRVWPVWTSRRIPEIVIVSAPPRMDVADLEPELGGTVERLIDFVAEV